MSQAINISGPLNYFRLNPVQDTFQVVQGAKPGSAIQFLEDIKSKVVNNQILTIRVNGTTLKDVVTTVEAGYDKKYHNATYAWLQRIWDAFLRVLVYFGFKSCSPNIDIVHKLAKEIQAELRIGPLRRDTLFNKDVLGIILNFSTPTEVNDMIRTCHKVSKIPNKDKIQKNSIINIFLRDWAVLPKDYSNFRKRVPGENPSISAQAPVVNPLPLPDDFRAELLKSCPDHPGKIIAQTYALLFAPDLLNGEPLTYNTFKPLMENPIEGHATPIRYIWEQIVQDHGNTPLRALGKSGYILISRDLIPGSRNKSYAVQQALVAKGGGEVPSFLEMIVLIAAIRNKTGKRLYADSPWTYTRCQEQSGGRQLVVGGFAPAGLFVYYYYIVHEFSGVAARRKFCPKAIGH